MIFNNYTEQVTIHIPENICAALLWKGNAKNWTVESL